MTVAAELRWHDRRQFWVAPPNRFEPRDYSVDVAAERDARAFIAAHHYAGSFPAARASIGLFGPGACLAGVAVFSVPITQRVIPAHTGHAPVEGVELGRFACHPSVRFNGESWFLARCWSLLRQLCPAVRAVVSYADPLERRDAAGQLRKRAHWGTIYQASNALHVGRSSPRTLVLTPDGAVISGRSLTKIRKLERGWEYAVRQLVAAGAPPRAFGEEPAAWVRRATPSLRRIRHPGNLVYVFGVDRATTRVLRERHRGGLPYPRAAAAT